jgi:hypothetical protein
VQSGTLTRRSLEDGGRLRVLGAKPRAPFTQNFVHTPDYEVAKKCRNQTVSSPIHPLVL